jgi:hypothetical protein
MEIEGPGKIALIFLGLAALQMVYKLVRNRGWRGAMFGAPVKRQVGMLELDRRGMVKTKLEVHVLEPREPTEGPHVGVSVIRSSVGSWQAQPVSLTRSEARRLADDLRQAADASESVSSRSAG